LKRVAFPTPTGIRLLAVTTSFLYDRDPASGTARRLGVIAVFSDVTELEQLRENLLVQERLRNQMARYLPQPVVERCISEGGSWEPGGDECWVTILSSDIRGFTTLSEQLSSKQTLDLLNVYFAEMTGLVFEYEGTLDKFVGDGLLAIFGAPYSRDDDAKRAVTCAIRMVQRVRALNPDLERMGLPTIAIGIGLNTGLVVAGNVGSQQRMDYTAVGDVVNTAFRLTSEALPDRSAGEVGAIVLSKTTYELVRNEVTAELIGERSLKGKAAPQAIYRVSIPESPENDLP
jgi:adenylate cyclase